MKQIKQFFNSYINIFFILYLENKINLTQICKKLNVNYAYLTKLSNKLKDTGLIYFIKKGREKYIYLTPKGKIIKEHLIIISKELFIKNEKN